MQNATSIFNLILKSPFLIHWTSHILVIIEVKKVTMNYNIRIKNNNNICIGGGNSTMHNDTKFCKSIKEINRLCVWVDDLI